MGMALRDRLSGAGLKPVRAAAVKSRGGERRMKSSDEIRAGGCPKDERKWTFRRRVVINISVVKTRSVSSSWDKSAGCLMTGRAATGVEGAWVGHRHSCGTAGTRLLMRREKLKRRQTARREYRYRRLGRTVPYEHRRPC